MSESEEESPATSRPPSHRRPAGWAVIGRVTGESAVIGTVTAAVLLALLWLGDVVAGVPVVPSGPGEAVRGLVALAVVAARIGAGIAVVVAATAALFLVLPLVLRPERRHRPVPWAGLCGVVVAAVLLAGLRLGPGEWPWSVTAAATGGVLTAWRAVVGIRRWDPTTVRPVRIRTSSGSVRSGAGTRLGAHLLARPWELLRVVAGRPFSDPGQDVVALKRGEAVAVGAFRLEGGHVRRGLVVLSHGSDGPLASWCSWRGGRGYGVVDPTPRPARVPARAQDVRWRRAGPQFRPFQLLVGDEHWLLLLPRHDLPLLQEVLPAGDTAR